MSSIQTEFVNITEARKQMPSIAKQTRKKPVVLLKNGKPLMVVISYDDFSKFQEWEENRKFEEKIKEWEASLPTKEATFEEEEAILKGKEDIKNNRFTTLKADDPRLASEFLSIE